MQTIRIRDKDISIIIGKILRWGVYISLFVALIGGIIFLYHHGGETTQMQNQSFVEKDNNVLELLRQTLNGVGSTHESPIIELGILLLIATPLARVVFSLFAFYLERDKMYVFITLIVLFIIFASILTGFGA